jgi:hypothetical protein
MTTASRTILLGSILAVMLFAGVAHSSEANKKKAALAAAGKWLALVDAGKYADSWRETPEAYRARVDQKRWEQSLQSDRGSEGACVARKFISSEFRKSPPNTAGNDSISIRFNTSFQNRKYALERLKLIFDKDGQWRVTEYVITSALPGLESIAMALLLLVAIVSLWRMELKAVGAFFGNMKRYP